MFNTTFNRPLMALAVVIGLLAAAAPASAAGIEEAAKPRTTVTMLDYEGSPVVTYSRAAPTGSAQPNSFLVDGPFSLTGTMGACDVSTGLHPDDANANVVPPRTTQLALENTLVSNIAAADPEVCKDRS